MTNTFEIDAECIAESDNAILCDIDGEEYWIPQSQILDESQVWRKGDEGILMITEWIAKKKDLM